MDTLIKINKDVMAAVFPTVTQYQSSLEDLNRWWDKVALVGKINSLNVPQSLLTNMLDTKDEFVELQGVLIENLYAEQVQQIRRKQRSIAQTLIDIPNRNLFERTADVGFLATDASIVRFLNTPQACAAQLSDIQQHMAEYAAKYTVYDDIMLFDSNGRLAARMNKDVTEQLGTDPAIEELLDSRLNYIEICRFSPVCPHKPVSSLFFAPVKDPDGNTVLGVLCLSFKLEDEMASLFNDLNDGSGMVMALLDDTGKVIESSHTGVLPKSEKLPQTHQEQLISLNGQLYYCTCAPTRGYQGYMGLLWQGCALMPFSLSLEQCLGADNGQAELDVPHWQGFSATLSDIQKRSKIVTDDLDLVVLNGCIAAARKDADEFIPILEEIRQIGRQMQAIFSCSVSQLMTTALTTHYNALSTQAALAIDIMDRNLYERANDCRWWALTEQFIQTLSTASPSIDAKYEMSTLLAYINGLYTVYTGIYVYDKTGAIIAVSSSTLNSWLTTQAQAQSQWRSVLSLRSSQQYCVSDFHCSDYYQQRPTYIYNAAIRHDHGVIGGIGLVFDSETEFRQMLDDVLNNGPTERVGVYVDRNGQVISASSGAPWQVGDQLMLPADILRCQSGSQGAGMYTLDNQQYVMGFAVSKGYREYKAEANSSDDIIALMIERNQS